MSLNIKNERVHELARTAARLTGRSQTSVIEEALSRLIEDLSPATAETDRRARALQIAEQFGARMRPGDRALLDPDSLYDDRGLSA